MGSATMKYHHRIRGPDKAQHEQAILDQLTVNTRRRYQSAFNPLHKNTTITLGCHHVTPILQSSPPPTAGKHSRFLTQSAAPPRETHSDVTGEMRPCTGGFIHHKSHFCVTISLPPEPEQKSPEPAAVTLRGRPLLVVLSGGPKHVLSRGVYTCVRVCRFVVDVSVCAACADSCRSSLVVV